MTPNLNTMRKKSPVTKKQPYHQSIKNPQGYYAVNRTEVVYFHFKLVTIKKKKRMSSNEG